MRYCDLVGNTLKSYFICDLFETYDVNVIYEFDRTHENIADNYRAGLPELGLEFLFNEHQKLIAIFIKLAVVSSYNPFNVYDERVDLCNLKTPELVNNVNLEAINKSVGNSKFLGKEISWIKFQYEGYSIHYQFEVFELQMITIQTD